MPPEFVHDGVTFHTVMPISWRVEPEISLATVEQWMHNNVVLMHALATMEALQTEKESEAGMVMTKTMERLEAKVDLTLALVAKLLAQHVELPSPLPVTLAAEALEWVAPPGQPPVGDIVISLYISPKLPQPLVLPARVGASIQEAEGLRIQAVFSHLTEEAQDWLARTIFRYHRRAIQYQHRTHSGEA